MKKILSFLLIFAILFTFIGCGKKDDSDDDRSGSKKKTEESRRSNDEDIDKKNKDKSKDNNGKIELDVGQMHINFKKDTVAISFNISSDDMEDMLDISMDESNDDIRDALIESFSNDFGDDVEMTSFKKGKNYVSFTIEVDAESFSENWQGSYHQQYTLSEFAEDYNMDSVEELCDYYTFLDFSSEDVIDIEDLAKYAENYVVYVGGSLSTSIKGLYFQFPDKILMITDSMEYKKISNNTIFVESGSGLVIVK